MPWLQVCRIFNTFSPLAWRGDEGARRVLTDLLQLLLLPLFSWHKKAAWWAACAYSWQDLRLTLIRLEPHDLFTEPVVDLTQPGLLRLQFVDGPDLGSFTD